jgi:hypothetical protein
MISLLLSYACLPFNNRAAFWDILGYLTQKGHSPNLRQAGSVLIFDLFQQ